MSEIKLAEHERIDRLLTEKYQIIQSTQAFCFSTDAVLLADFIKSKKIDRIIDLGTGGGVLPLLLIAKGKGEKIEALELQEQLADMAQRSMQLNGLQEQVHVQQGDLRQVKDYYAAQSFDVVVCNPPYFPVTKHLNVQEAVAVAKHELKANLEDVVKAAAYLLKNSGKFTMVHRPDRLTDILLLLRAYRLEPKRLKLVYPNENAEPNLLLIEAGKNGKPGLRILPPTYIYQQDGSYTEILRKIYFGEEQKS